MAMLFPDPGLTLTQILIAVPVIATVTWPINSWVIRRARQKFGADRTTWSTSSDPDEHSLEGAIRAVDGVWNHGRFVVADGVLRWFPRFSDSPRWETGMADTSVREVRSPKPGEWWSVNPNCLIVSITSSNGEAELVLFKSDLDLLRQQIAKARISDAD
jgi:hypothetical protein